MKELFQINNIFYHKKLSEENLTEICQKIIFSALFKETPLRNSSKDPFSFEIDIPLDPYDSIWLKLTTILVYCVEVMASIVMVAFVAFETQGFAGHFRTLINQLLSYLYGGVSIQLVTDLIFAIVCPIGILSQYHLSFLEHAKFN